MREVYTDAFKPCLYMAELIATCSLAAEESNVEDLIASTVKLSFCAFLRSL